MAAVFTLGGREVKRNRARKAVKTRWRLVAVLLMRVSKKTTHTYDSSTQVAETIW